MELADPQRSFAVLIGASAYESASLEDLPAVANNVMKLAELLRDPSVWGLPADRCVVVAEPRTPYEVLDAVHTAARRAEDTLLVYYAGHGLVPLTDINGLLLTVAGTDRERQYTAVNFDDVRHEVLAADHVANRVVVLDCCYSGRAFAGGGMSGERGAVEMAEQARIAGSYLLAACAGTRLAQAPPGETYTAFTGELIRLLETGLPGGDSLIEVTKAYERLYAELRAKGRPLPQQRLSNAGRTLAFATNRRRFSRGCARRGIPRLWWSCSGASSGKENGRWPSSGQTDLPPVRWPRRAGYCAGCWARGPSRVHRAGRGGSPTCPRTRRRPTAWCGPCWITSTSSRRCSPWAPSPRSWGRSSRRWTAGTSDRSSRFSWA